MERDGRQRICKRCHLADRYRGGRCRPCALENQNAYWATNLPMRMANAQRTRLVGAYKSQGLCVPRKVFALLGCTALALVAHIESQFVEGMTWSTYPKPWEVDHIKPLSQYELADPEQAALACSYHNLRLLLISEHKQKSRLEGLARLGSTKALADFGSQEQPRLHGGLREASGTPGVLLAGV